MVDHLFSRMVLAIINNSKQVLVKITDRFSANVVSKWHMQDTKNMH